MNRKRNWSLSLFAVLTLILASCSPLMPAAYPEPATSTESIRPYKTRTVLPTIWPTKTPFPTADREYPIPNLPPKAWPEFSGEYTYSNIDISENGFLKYGFRYPPGWYLYPGSTISAPGLEGETYIQNFERIGMDWWYEPQSVGTVKISLYALPCKIVEEGCLTNIPEFAPGLPGTRAVEKREDWTVWEISLYTKYFRISLAGYMPGNPAGNAALIEVLDEIPSTFVVHDESMSSPVETSTP